MQSNNKNQQVLITILGVTIHRLGINMRKKLEYGKCSIIKNDQQAYLKVHNFILVLKNKQFLQIKYSKSVSYFYLNQSYPESICVISIPYSDNSDQLINSFYTNLSAYAEVNEINDLTNSQQLLIKSVSQFYPDYLNKQVMSHGNKLTKISKQVGGLVGALSGFLGKPAKSVGQKVQNKKQQIYENKVGTSTKNKWNTVKETASKLNDSISQKFKPVNNGLKNVSNKIGDSFDNSNNTIIKAIRDFGIKTKKALNQGYKQKSGQMDVHTNLKNQSDSVL